VITATVIGGDELAARLAALPGVVTQALAQTVAELSAELRDVVERKLSGEVLRQRTGRLAASVAVDLHQDGNAVAATLSSDVEYAAIHEYGGAIPAHEVLPRSARALAFPWKGRQRFFKRVEIPTVTMPQRSFLQSALAEMTPTIRAALADAVRAAVRQEVGT
jgi:phage gpG-like protein